MARFKSGVDLWECGCGEVVVMGKRCPACGKNYADVLRENSAIREKKRKRPERKSKYRDPEWEEGFLKSFFRKKGTKTK